MAKPSGTPVKDRLQALARNLWWTWSAQAQQLFAYISPAAWDAGGHAPLKMLGGAVSHEVLRQIAGDAAFLTQLAKCELSLREYMRARTWFGGRHSGKKLLVAYFCAEYGIHESLAQYAGGLGILAGDHLKSASDLGIPLVGVGLLYTYGYYRQQFRKDGSTAVIYANGHDPTAYGCVDTKVKITVPMAGRSIRAKIWQLQVGRVAVYLLDTRLPENRPADRALMDHLYGGDQEYRIRQEILLGVGGVLALDALGIKPTVYHLNEGHAAFCALERLRKLRVAKMPHDRAVQKIRETTVFTTHTPVPEGHDRFPPALANKYLGRIADQMGLSHQELLALGRENPADKTERFCMTVLALRLSARCNGVAKLHGDTSRRMWAHIFGHGSDLSGPGLRARSNAGKDVRTTIQTNRMPILGKQNPDDVPIGHVTNGIHPQTWLAPEIRPLYEKYLKPRWLAPKPGDDCWSRAGNIPPPELWSARNTLRARLVQFVRRRLVEQAQGRLAPIEQIVAAQQTFDGNTLTIGFARRFATYKRAPLIFRDAKRLARILSNSDRPAQLVFAGKAHPLDPTGQQYAQQIFRHAASPLFRGRVALLENYDMEIGRVLTAGADVWLNNPLRPQEASGTSGMKPALHGGLNCSVLDGWWPEAFNGRNGWAIGDGRQLKSRAAQDRYDADCIYDLLENSIIPAFYDRDRSGIPARWLKMAVESMKTICAAFSSHRMLSEYLTGYYLPSVSS